MALAGLCLVFRGAAPRSTASIVPAGIGLQTPLLITTLNRRGLGCGLSRASVSAAPESVLISRICNESLMEQTVTKRLMNVRFVREEDDILMR